MDKELSESALELEERGWIRQFMIDPDRALEYIDLYEEIGQEVRVEQATPELMMKEEFTTCEVHACEAYVIIYTRANL